MAPQNPAIRGITSIFSRIKRMQIFAVGLLFVILNFPASFAGSDIEGARNNFSNSYRIDFQGAVQTLTYGLVPNVVFLWSSWLLLLQILCTTIGLSFIRRSLDLKESLKAKVVFGCLVYITFALSSQGTRDGTMLSLVILGIGLYLESLRKKSPQILVVSIFILLWAGSLRPWVSLAIPLFIFSVSRLRTNSSLTAKIHMSIGRLLVLVTFSVTCLLVEFTLDELLELESSYPEQQVMIMDLTAYYCLGNNIETAAQAESALSNFYKDEKFKMSICQFFRTDTWVSLRDSKYPSTSNLISNFSLIMPGEEALYKNVRDKWLNIIKNDPVGYLQAKHVFASKLLIGSDSREISLPNFKNSISGDLNDFQMTFRKVLMIPFQVVTSLHLLSSLVSNLFLFAILMRKKPQWPNSTTQTVALLFAANTVWLSLTAIAYIGSNARYLYLPSLLVFILIFIDFYKSKANE